MTPQLTLPQLREQLQDLEHLLLTKGCDPTKVRVHFTNKVVRKVDVESFGQGSSDFDVVLK